MEESRRSAVDSGDLVEGMHCSEGVFCAVFVFAVEIPRWALDSRKVLGIRVLLRTRRQERKCAQKRHRRDTFQHAAAYRT